ncbi:uncharacterized protein [Epargyreus clarus]|uniref:uncharacterized protein n=1 Tax=Epargyreus clarus TaxID=520877 RepID=UPI003C2F1C4C
MGCGSSGQVVAPEDTTNGHKMNGRSTNGHDHHNDDLPTVVLPDTPAQPKPPIAYEIPLEEFDSTRKPPNTPPPHLQRLLQPPAAEISLPDIKEKLAEAELRRQAILQQRAASAQKRTQKMIKNLQDIDRLENERNAADATKHLTNSLTIPPEPGVCEHKII